MDRRRLLGALAAAPAALALGAAAKEPKRKDPPQPRASKRRKGVKSPDKHVDVAIVGAGAVGAWTAWHLVRQGLDVRLFDAYGAGNGRAASNLPTMLCDPAQAGDALYADLAHDSLPLWQRLSDSASLPIVTPCAAVTTLLPTDGADEPPGTDRTTGHKLRSRFGAIGWRDEEAALVADKAARVRRFQAATVSALWDISCAMGLDSPWQIQPHHLSERLNSARSDSIDRIYKFYDRGVLLADPDSVSSARYWAMARANSFRAAL